MNFIWTLVFSALVASGSLAATEDHHGADFDFSAIPIDDQSRVVFFGEVHTDQTAKRMLIANMNAIKDLGFTAIGLEALRADHQDQIDGFLAGTVSDDQMERVFRDDFQWDAMAWLALAVAARDAGLRIVALNAPSFMRSVWRVQGRAEWTITLDLRDQFSVDLIESWVTRFPNERLISIWGLYHFLRSADRRDNVAQQERLTLRGIRSQTYILAARCESYLGAHNLIPEIERHRPPTKDFVIVKPSLISPVDGLIFSERYALKWRNELARRFGTPEVAE